MKKIFAILTLCLSALTTVAQTNQYIIYSEEAESKIALIAKTIDIPQPGARLTLNAKHSASSVTTNKALMGSLKIEQKVNNQWETLYEDNPGIVTEGDITLPVVGTVVGKKEVSVANEPLSFDINYRATQIRFSRSGAGSALNDKLVSDIKIYMASFVEVKPEPLDFGEMVVWSEPVEKKFYVEHCNVARLSMTSSNSDFALNTNTVANSGIAVYATDTFSVTFTPNIMGQHEATIIVTNGTQTDSIHCRAKVTKRTPIFTSNLPETMTVGDVIALPVSSDCENLLVISTCSDELSVRCGEIKALEAGTATFEAVQLGDDDYWNNKTEEFTVTIVLATATNQAAIREATADRILREGQVIIRTTDRQYTAAGQQK